MVKSQIGGGKRQNLPDTTTTEFFQFIEKDNENAANEDVVEKEDQ